MLNNKFSVDAVEGGGEQAQHNERVARQKVSISMVCRMVEKSTQRKKNKMRHLRMSSNAAFVIESKVFFSLLLLFKIE